MLRSSFQKRFALHFKGVINEKTKTTLQIKIVPIKPCKKSDGTIVNGTRLLTPNQDVNNLDNAVLTYPSFSILG